MSGAPYGWQQDAWQRARAAIARGAHALLVAGPRGSGKRDFAFALAAGYLCGDPADRGIACGTCESCRWVAAGTHPDLALVEPLEDEEAEEPRASAPPKRARAIAVDQVRELSGLLGLTAHRTAGKAIVLSPADAMNVAASNALLKNLEEPPPGALFILVAHRRALLLPTVRSRCQLVPMRVDDRAAIRAWLAEHTDSREPELLLGLAGGAPMEAAAIAGDAHWSRRQAFLRGLASAEADPVRLAETYHTLPPSLVLSWLQTWTFDLVHARFCGRCRYHRDLEALALQIGAEADPIAVSRLYRKLAALQRHIQHPLNARLLVEQLLIGYCEAAGPARAHA